jgi:hypothetical protein
MRAFYLRDHIEKTLDDAPGDVKLVLSGTAPNGIPLITLGYHYSKKATLLLVMASKTGNSTSGNPCRMKCSDRLGT